MNMVYRCVFLVSLASFKCNLMYYTEGRYKEREIVNGLKVKVMHFVNEYAVRGASFSWQCPVLTLLIWELIMCNNCMQVDFGRKNLAFRWLHSSTCTIALSIIFYQRIQRHIYTCTYVSGVCLSIVKYTDLYNGLTIFAYTRICCYIYLLIIEVTKWIHTGACYTNYTFICILFCRWVAVWLK